MKKIIIVALLTIGLASCGKKDSNSNNTTPTTTSGTVIKLKANGVATELNYTPIWTYESSPKMYGLGITQNKTGAAAPERQLFSIRIQESDFVVGGTHEVGVANNNEFIYIANYRSSKGQYKANKSFAKSHGTFTITKIADIDGTKKKFYGTFSGTVINSDGDSIVITEGQIIE
ncbi:MAG: hypothetical protein WC716_04870 [Chitinophagaceae bacterium]|jgi:hypothetical protein